MTLRKKTVFVIGLMMIGLIGFLFAISSGILLRRVAQAEREQASQNVRQVVGILSDSLGQLSAQAATYATDRDCVALLEGSGAGASRLTSDAAKRNRLSFVLMVGASGQLMFGKSFDWTRSLEQPVPASILQDLDAGGVLGQRRFVSNGIRGIVMMTDGPALVAARPVTGGQAGDFMAGTVIIGRRLDRHEMKYLAGVTHLSLAVNRYRRGPRGPDFGQAPLGVAGNPPVIAEPVSDETIAGYALLNDLRGQPALVVRAEMLRTIHQQGQIGVSLLLASLLAAGLVFGVVSLILMEKMVLTPLANLGEDLARIGAGGDLASRVEVSGRDELSRLAATINDTLQALELAQRKVLEYEERYRAVVKQSSEGILLVDTETKRFLEANAALLKLLGYSSEQLFALKFYDLFPEDRESIERTVQGVLAHRRHFLGERQLRCRDDSLIDVELSIDFISHGGREVLCVVFRDISVRKEAEQTLRLAHDELEIRVRERTGELNEANVALQAQVAERVRAEDALRDSNRRLQEVLDELKRTQQQIIQHERLRALGQMASGIAHDFNNALAPILGFTELLLNRPENLRDPAKTSRYLQTINTATRDAANVVSRLREFYRPRGDDVFAPVNVNALIEQVVSLTQPRWKDQSLAGNIAIRVEPELQDVPLIEGNEAELREALTNLIFNAVDAMPGGGVIALRSRAVNGFVELEIADNGTGMTEEVRQHCFEPFFSTKGERGTGLGLAMVHGVVSRHEGTIDVQSVPGQGTTFVIRLPVHAVPRAVAPLPKVEASDRSLRILMAEDEPLILEIQAEYLQADGHTVETARNGREGWEKFRARKYDLVVLDRAMPEMNGDQLAAAIKKASPQTPVIMVTGFGDMIKVAEGQPACVDAVVGKPVTLTELRQAVAQLSARANVN